MATADDFDPEQHYHPENWWDEWMFDDEDSEDE